MDFEIHSVDVIHTFWVPAFRLQEDAVPGITTGFRATPDRIGTYPIICNQLCGYGHSTMRTTLHIVSAATFNSWLADHGYSGGAAQTTATPTRRSRVEVAAANGSTGYAPASTEQTKTKEGTQ